MLHLLHAPWCISSPCSLDVTVALANSDFFFCIKTHVQQVLAEVQASQGSATAAELCYRRCLQAGMDGKWVMPNCNWVVFHCLDQTKCSANHSNTPVTWQHVKYMQPALRAGKRAWASDWWRMWREKIPLTNLVFSVRKVSYSRVFSRWLMARERSAQTLNQPAWRPLQ